MNEETKSAKGQGQPGNRHILFKTQEPRFSIENPVVNVATVYFSDFTESRINLARMLNEFSSLTPDDKINLIINSPGGYAREGKAFINTIQRTGALINTELLAEAASMAALMFCIGSNRVIYENSSIMFHTFSGGYSGKGNEIKDYANHATKHMESFFKALIIGLDEVEIQKMFDGKEYWFDAKKMCQRGIATHVSVHDLLIPAKKYLKLLKKVKKTAKKLNIKIDSLAEALIFNIDALTPLQEEQQKQFDETQQKLLDLVNENDILLTR